jgi:predicted nucleic acid-binding protein
MPRQKAEGRVPAIGRKPAEGRVRWGFPEDDKVHAVLDTNVIIYALEALYKKQEASQIEIDSLKILQVVSMGDIVVGINGALFAEYRSVAERKIAEGRANPSDANAIIGLIETKSVAVRLPIVHQRFSTHENDDILFDGLSTSYLVSNNLKHVAPAKLIRPSSYAKTLTPTDFIAEMIINGIIR